MGGLCEGTWWDREGRGVEREILGVKMIGGNSREMGSVTEEGNKKSSPNGVTSSQTTGGQRGQVQTI